MLFKFVPLSFIIVATLVTSIAWRDFEIVFNNISCLIHSKKLKTFDCSIRYPRKDLSLVTIRVAAAEDVYFSQVRTKMELIGSGKQLFTIADTTVDVCGVLEGVPLLALGLSVLLKQIRETNISHIPEKCPLKKNVEYFVKDFHLDADKLPPSTPNFKINYTAVLGDGELLGYFEVVGQIVSKSKPEKKRLKH